MFNARAPVVLKELLVMIDDVNQLHDTLSRQISASTATVVEITAPPFVYAESPVSPNLVLVWAVVYYSVVGAGMIVFMHLPTAIGIQ